MDERIIKELVNDDYEANLMSTHLHTTLADHSTAAYTHVNNCTPISNIGIVLAVPIFFRIIQ